MKDTVRPAGTEPAPRASRTAEPPEIVEQLRAALSAEGVTYRHRRSGGAAGRSTRGGDLDVVVARGHEDGFLAVLAQLGFKAASGPGADAGVGHYYGLDHPSGGLVHVRHRRVRDDDPDETASAARRRGRPQRPVPARLASGGAVVAVVGGDGAGKSTAVEGLASWLSTAFVVRAVHIGRPPRSAASFVVKRVLAAGHRLGLFPELAAPTAAPADPLSAPSTAWLLWHVMTARDRHRLHARSRRVAASGGIVVCDRYPLEQLRSMDAPRTSWARDLPGLSRLAAALIDREAYYYAGFAPPDVLAVLRVHPEVAVRRKTEEEENYVRSRSTEVWTASWDEGTEVVDASQPAAQVLADLKAAVWARL